ncbi:MAG TPA: lipoate--protein ligase family protein [Nocardioidaceae bacterium]|nr:lipoate--protein ligase family protein [Nocardioidaceae bacterium]
MTVLVSEEGLPQEPTFAVALGPLLLRRGLEGADEVVRVHVPAPAAAFSRRDTRRPGFPAAAEAARDLGFEPVVRPQGGQLAAYHGGSVVVDHLLRSSESSIQVGTRFDAFAQLHARALEGLGVDVRIGAVPGEYCPGEFSLNIGGRYKIAGSAQRVTRDGWLFSTVFQVRDSASLRLLLQRAYTALEYEFDPHTVGCIEDAEVDVTVELVARLLVESYGDLELVELPASIVEAGRDDASAYGIDYRPSGQ